MTHPASGGERIASLDFVRGIAVLGILLPNILSLGQPLGAGTWPGSFLVPHGAFDDSLWIVQLVLFDGKMRGLFTLLFGAGLVLFLDQPPGDGSRVLLQIRRLFWLAVFGLAHFFLLWRGDILFGYAVIGLCLIPFARLKANELLVMAGIGLVIGVILDGAMAWSVMEVDASPFIAAELGDDRVETALVEAGAYAAWVRHTLAAHAAEPIDGVLSLLFETAPLMLLGMGLYRADFFARGCTAPRSRIWAWALLLGGGVATLAIGLWAYRSGLSYSATFAAQVGWSSLPRIAMILGLAILLVPIGARSHAGIAAALRASGRCAFSNYLGTSLCAVLLFHGFGGGLYGEFSRGALYLVAFAGWGLMLLWPQWWLARYRYGPLEWLWRSLTQARLAPMRVAR